MPSPGTSPTQRAEAQLAADLAILARLGLVRIEGAGPETRVSPVTVAEPAARA